MAPTTECRKGKPPAPPGLDAGLAAYEGARESELSAGLAASEDEKL